MSEPVHVMLDLETLGNVPGCVIVSIGAVHFRRHPETGACEILASFSKDITPQSCEQVGLKLDAATVLWWLKQSEAARNDLLKGQEVAINLPEALFCFRRWISQRTPDDQNLRIWGKGPSFDCAVLAAAYRACQIALPWRYSGERCFRTIAAMYPDLEEDAREGVHHSAIDDATHQARHLIKIENQYNPLP